MMQDQRIPSGCAISGFMNTDGTRVSGEPVTKSIALMHDRCNGLGGGFAAYGIYPEFSDCYALHIMFDDDDSRQETERFLKQNFDIVSDEAIPTAPVGAITGAPILWRYFTRPKTELLWSGRTPIGANGPGGMSSIRGPASGGHGAGGPRADSRTLMEEAEDDFAVACVMHINGRINGAYVSSSGKNMGAFKGVGYPEDISRFFRLDEYEGYTWIAHGRFPTNTPGWWGGAHPFCILDWSVVHNGEISSYGINRRYLETYGYKCTLQTDTEVIAYLLDLLERRHRLPLRVVCSIFAPPFWKDIDRMGPEERALFTAIRQVYGSALLNGPFSVIVGNSREMIGLNDRIKLRPMAVATKGETVYMASEESAILEICESPDQVWLAKGGEPVVARLRAAVETETRALA